MTSLHLTTPQYKDLTTYRIPDNNESILSLGNYFTAKSSKPSHQENNLPHNTLKFGENANLMLTTDGIAMYHAANQKLIDRLYDRGFLVFSLKTSVIQKLCATVCIVQSVLEVFQGLRKLLNVVQTHSQISEMTKQNSNNNILITFLKIHDSWVSLLRHSSLFQSNHCFLLAKGK